MPEEITPEDRGRHYSAMLDSVNLLNSGKPEDMSDSDWAEFVSRNVGHLKVMLQKKFWTNESMEVFKLAIKRNYK